MFSVRFRSNLRFAFRKETLSERGNVSLNWMESLGNYLSWFVYEFRKAMARLVCDPRFVTVVFTLVAMVLTSLIFYPHFTATSLFDSVTWMVNHINWHYVRFGLWLLSEITILGLGMRAFGRFSNQPLMHHYFPERHLSQAP